MKTIKVNLYSFNELSKESQNKALNKLRDINVNFDWWDVVYEDAKNIGVKISSFDLDRNKHVNGKLSNEQLTARLIMEQHGQMCLSYKLAAKYLSDLSEQEQVTNDLTDLNNQFKNDLLTYYANELQTHYDFLISDEQVKETIEANDYTFEADGRLNNTKPEQETSLKTAWDFVEKYHPNYSSSDEICWTLELMLRQETKELPQTDLEQLEYYLKQVYEESILNYINTQNK